MKKTSIVKLVAIGILAHSNVYALDITSGKLLGSKEWLTGDAKPAQTTTLNSHDMRAKYFTKLNHPANTQQTNHQEERDAILAVGQIRSMANVTPNAENVITGFRIYNIINSTSLTHTYTVTTNLCLSEESSALDNCVVHQDVIELNPYGSADDIKTPSMINYFTDKKSYLANISVQITRDGQNTTYETGDVTWVYVDSSGTGSKKD